MTSQSSRLIAAFQPLGLFAGLLLLIPCALGRPPALAATVLQPILKDLPLTFIENRGQLPGFQGYYADGYDRSVYFQTGRVTFALSEAASTPRHHLANDDARGHGNEIRAAEPAHAPVRRRAVEVRFIGASPNVRPVAEREQGGTVSYFTGPPAGWKVGLKRYQVVRYRQLWPGIDLVYQAAPGKLKYEFHVAPGASPDRIRLAYRGASEVRVNPAGELEAATPLGSLKDEAPVAYQSVGGRQVLVATRWGVEAGRGADRTVRFRVGEYDPALPLVIDPAVLQYCGFLGASGYSSAHGVAVDAFGCAYVVGSTTSPTRWFPGTGGPDLTSNGGVDAFIAKLKADGSGFEYCGYLGGAGDDEAEAVAVDPEGNAYLCGSTSSGEVSFPIHVGPDLSYNGGRRSDSEGEKPSDAFIAKVSTDGTALEYCGYIGGTNNDVAYDVTTTHTGIAYVCGDTNSGSDTFPITEGPDLTSNGGRDGFVAKVDPGGGALAYCGFIGGASNDGCSGIAVDAAGNAFVCGSTSSRESSFPLLVGPALVYTPLPGPEGDDNNAFVACVRGDGTGLVFCGYIGPGHAEDADVGATGNLYVCGATRADETLFPVTVGPDLSHNGGHDGFVAKLLPDGTGFVYCGYIGGQGGDRCSAVAVDAEENTYVAGFTASPETSFPVVSGPSLSFSSGIGDGFVGKVCPDGSRLDYCGYIGGNGYDAATGVAVDDADNAYTVGYAFISSDNFPVVGGPSHNLDVDGAFVARVTVLPTPEAPADVSVIRVSPTAGQLVWSSDPGEVISFRIERQHPGGVFHEVGAVPGDSRAFRDDGLLGESGYSYRVRARNRYGFSPYSVVAFLRSLPPAGFGAAPFNYVSIRLGWGSDAKDIDIERQSAGASYERIAFLPKGRTSYLDKALAPGTEYTYRIRTWDSGYFSEYTPPVVVKLPRFAPPTGFTATAVSMSRIDLTWDRADHDLDLVLERQTGADPFELVANTTQGALGVSDTHLKRDTEYTYRIRASNGSVYSDPSPAVTIRTKALGPLMTISPTTLRFPPTRAGRRSRRAFTIRNDGDMWLGVDVMVYWLDYPFSGDSIRARVEPGETRKIFLTFRPDSGDWGITYSTTLKIVGGSRVRRENRPPAPGKVRLQGRAIR
jgi:hypothetical protein